MRRRRRQPRRQPPAVARTGAAAAAAALGRAAAAATQPALSRALPGPRSGDALHAVHSDLGPVPVRATSTTSQAGCYRLRHGDPVDVRVSRRHGRVALSFLHELGHFVDHQLGRELGDTWASGRARGVLGLATGRIGAAIAAAGRRGPVAPPLLQLVEGDLGAQLRTDRADALAGPAASGRPRRPSSS